MVRKPEHNRKRLRVQMSIDPDVWQRCQELSAIAGPLISWSQVAEYSFVTLLDQMEVMKVEVFSRLRPDATQDEIKTAIQAYIARQMHLITADAYAQIDEELKQPPTPVKQGRRAG